ncbi:MAG TPA: Asp-tRNA(Asn)/Glu-tRNA(Gln) amidotransferase subunit GatC [Gemmatimonadaceae bacterium]|nr:Asp-tRNA(Asn)/Glu-tRNA(Gln) amidotransferase subunit GatC [Gemmatimonadaceae bacterium]
MAVRLDDLRHVMELAHLELPEERTAELLAQLNDILAHMEELRAVDTSGVPPAAGVGDAPLPLRVDEGPSVPLARPLAAFAPATRDGFLLVPRLATHEGVGNDASGDDA